MAGASTSAAVSMKEYLKKYRTGTDTDDKNKPKKTKKKKKVENPKSTALGGVLVVDEDPVWQKPVIIEEEDDSDSAGEAETLVEEDIEVRRMKRLEAIRAKNPYNSISEDGSGWIPVANSPPQNSPDLSPPRQRRKRLDTPSPDHRSRADLSPPRRNANLSPPRRRARHDSVETADLSPPRRRGQHDSVETADLSPPRRRSRHDSVETADLSPPRRRSRHDSVETADLSPRRRKSRFDSDKTADLSPPRRARADVAEKREKAAPRRGGFFTTEEIKEEIKQKKEEERIKLLDSSISGKNAETIFRDKATGKRVSKEDLLKNAKKQEKPKESEKELEWGKGLAQKRKLEERALELEKEKSTPFARSRDDPELDKMLKETVRWGDPMAHLARKKNMETILEDLGDDERMKESGFIIPQNIPNHSWIKRGVDFPENRYGIKPGRHWDGVDRSNGFEKDMFKRQNEKRSTEQEAYLWSVADM